MNAKEFSRLYAETYNTTYSTATFICNTLFPLLGKLIYEDNQDVVINGFGSFRHRVSPEQKRRHPGTGEIVTLPEKVVVKFKPSEKYTKE